MTDLIAKLRRCGIDDAAAEIESLRSRLAEVEKERNENAVALARATRLADERYEYTCKVLAERNVSTIRAELAEQDAARYRWLMDKDDNPSITGRFNAVYRRWDGEDGANGFTAALDAAMEQSQ